MGWRLGCCRQPSALEGKVIGQCMKRHPPPLPAPLPKQTTVAAKFLIRPPARLIRQTQTDNQAARLFAAPKVKIDERNVRQALHDQPLGFALS